MTVTDGIKEIIFIVHERREKRCVCIDETYWYRIEIVSLLSCPSLCLFILLSGTFAIVRDVEQKEEE
jgi:hypothetical protein